MRSKNSMLNIISVLLMQVSSLFISLISRRVFLDNLPVELLGVTGLFNSFFYSVGLIDIGFSSILIYNLYKPVNEKNEEEIKRNVAIFKKIYTFIGFIVITISLCVMPFLNNVFKIDYDNVKTVYLIYIVQLMTVSLKYFFLHKSNILVVNQKRYIINFLTVGIDLISFILKMVAILIFKSYVVYLMVIFLYSLTIELINLYITHKSYPYLKKLPKVTFKDVVDYGAIKQSKNYLFRTVYDFVYYSTDNFIISMKLGTYSISFLENYTMIFNIFDTFLSQIISSLRDSFANFLYAEKDVGGLFSAYKKMNIMNYFFVSIATVGLYCLIDNFIGVWLGERFIIDSAIKNILLINLAMDLLFRPLENIFSIKGYVFKEKIPLLISAITNLILSWILIDYWGLFGIFFGTFVGKIIFWCGKLYYVGNDVFKKQKFKLLNEQLLFVLLAIVETVIIANVINNIFVAHSLLLLIVKGILCVVITLLVNIILFIRNEDFKGLLNLALNAFKQLVK